jgi:hypothetical protein
MKKPKSRKFDMRTASNRELFSHFERQASTGVGPSEHLQREFGALFATENKIPGK